MVIRQSLLLCVWMLMTILHGGHYILSAQESTGVQDEDSGIATGYDGHFACRQFTGDARQLAIAVSDLESAKVAKLLAEGADINARAVPPYAQRMTILQTSIVYDWDLEAIRLLIRSGADVTLQDGRGDTALALACRNPSGADPEVVRELVRAGALVDAKGVGGMTPLMHAAIHDSAGKTISALIDASADVAAVDSRGWTALMHATRRRIDPAETVRQLLEAGSPVNAKHSGGGTALSNAAFQGHARAIPILLAAGAKVNSRDSANWTPLICASLNGHAKCVEELLKGGARVNDTDRLGRTALSLARNRRANEVEELLVAAGARK